MRPAYGPGMNQPHYVAPPMQQHHAVPPHHVVPQHHAVPPHHAVPQHHPVHGPMKPGYHY